MNITNIVITKTAVETTANGVFTVDYSTTNGVLNRIQASVQTPSEIGGQVQIQAQPVGTIYMEHGYVNCSLTEEAKPALLLKDFDTLVEKIKKSVEGEQDNNQHTGGGTN
ncbi:MAG: hypothetical protein RR471_04675 [Bacteroides sp.]